MHEEDQNISIPLMSDLAEEGRKPEYLLWIGCAGAYDERYKKVIRSLIRVLHMAEVDFAVLGDEESCTGDPARRAGNEFLFQMQALSNIQVLNNYQINRIITPCPHCFHIIKNEYPALGGHYEVIHHTQLLTTLINDRRLPDPKTDNEKSRRVTYHDSCYLGRSNNIYDDPRQVIHWLQDELREMERKRENGLCCGAGGAQMFKDAEPGDREINMERTEEALDTSPEVIATACPFCLTMMSDGVKEQNRDENVQVIDIVELLEKKLQGQQQAD